MNKTNKKEDKKKYKTKKEKKKKKVREGSIKDCGVILVMSDKKSKNTLASQ